MKEEEEKMDEEVEQPVLNLGGGWRPWEGMLERRERSVITHYKKQFRKSC